MYIHCKGGHGRAGLVVATLLSYIYNISPEESLRLTSSYHSTREIMKDKWRKLGSPQTAQQKNFVYHFCKPIYFYNVIKNDEDNISVLSTYFNCKIILPEGTFSNAECALQAFKSIDDKDYVIKQINCKSGKMSKIMGDRIKPTEYWEKNKRHIAYKILKAKFKTNDTIKSVLLNTKLCKIINKTDDTYWGVNYFNKGLNVLGQILTEIREEFLLEN